MEKQKEAKQSTTITNFSDGTVNLQQVFQDMYSDHTVIFAKQNSSVCQEISTAVVQYKGKPSQTHCRSPEVSYIGRNYTTRQVSCLICWFPNTGLLRQMQLSDSSLYVTLN